MGPLVARLARRTQAVGDHTSIPREGWCLQVRIQATYALRGIAQHVPTTPTMQRTFP
jgi:hypothetical protein